MKSTISSIALVASLLSAVSAVPLEKREAFVDVEVVTQFEVATAYATVYATEGAPVTTATSAVYVEETTTASAVDAPETTTASAVYVPETTTAASSAAYIAETTTVADLGLKGHSHVHAWQWHTTTSSSTSSAAYVAPAPETTSTSTSTSEAPVVTFVPPTTTELPAWTAPTIVPVAPTTTSTWQAPAAAPTLATTPSAYEGDASYSDANMQIAIMNSTNTYRTMFQAAPVSWNQSLVDMAVASAASCDWEHTNAGQNLAAGYGGPQDAVGGWGDEYKTFDFSKPDFSESDGHFTQLVWQDTTTVGCAAKKCPTDGSTGASGWFLICNYFPVGNMLGEFPENVKSLV